MDSKEERANSEYLRVAENGMEIDEQRQEKRKQEHRVARPWWVLNVRFV